MRPFVALPDGTMYTPPKIREVGTIEGAGLTNGMTSLGSEGFVLVADTALGGVWRVDVRTGKYSAEKVLPFLVTNTDRLPLRGFPDFERRC